MSEPNAPSGAEQVRALYEQAESRAADAFEELVSKPSFGVLLARSAENVAAISRLSSDLADLVLRNLRVAGRADVTRLARQLQRSEDKLERLLQEVEERAHCPPTDLPSPGPTRRSGRRVRLRRHPPPGSARCRNRLPGRPQSGLTAPRPTPRRSGHAGRRERDPGSQQRGVWAICCFARVRVAIFG